MKIYKLFNVKNITIFLSVAAAYFLYLLSFSSFELLQIVKFNEALKKGDAPEYFVQGYEARFATAYQIAKKGHFKEATILFNNLAKEGTDDQKSAVYYNIGNIYFKRSLILNGSSNSPTVKDEAEYLMQQAKKAYEQSLTLNNQHWDVKHNLDRLLTMLPKDPAPGIGDSDSPGLIMGNIPVGLP
ncbi:MAG: hypothetical protein HOF49_01795 [Nitrosomonadales bacterium]|jgi:hypothetical protein|nr:hypothetical protein [Nitrosomonadales bacterium]MBT3918716.1 hypothetical protein [Nitrosomonadales bacterium]MBT4182788.1 hypothetical protein [Nitrosomonadales bacterium]MBT4758878.1 hypothetical protein [Nitrosomonadales bacterium]MBT5573275.1 hypothetical protein [Nitrosomonadales bacterium]